MGSSGLIFLRALSAAVILTCPGQSHLGIPLTHPQHLAQELCSSTGPRPTLCPTQAAGQPVLSLHLLLPLSTAWLDLRNALAGGTCPSITWQQLLNPSCCQQTCYILLPWVPCRHRCSLSSTCGSSSFAESPEKGGLFAVPLNQPGSGLKPRWSLQAHGCKVHG